MNITQIIFSFSHTLFFTLIGLIGISLIIAFHEFGHFIFCKIFNIRTPTFSIGFGPKLVSKKIGDTEFALSSIPLGGYVEIAGAAEAAQGSKDKQSFAIKPWYQKFLVMMGGILFNLIFAYGSITLLFLTGMPKTQLLYPENTLPSIAMVAKGSPAEKAGLQENDRIIALRVGSTESSVTPASMIPGTLKKSPGTAIAVRFERNNQEQETIVTPEPKQFMGDTIGYAGIILQTQPLPSYTFFHALSAGIALSNSILYRTITGFRYIFSSGDTSGIQGPIKIIASTMEGAKEGFKTFILFLAFISISLAVLNLLPLPILDGGQIVYYTIEAIAGRPLPERVREYIHIACWLAFIALALFLSYRDIKGLILDFFTSK